MWIIGFGDFKQKVFRGYSDRQEMQLLEMEYTFAIVDYKV